jgi:hypothetical protein
LVPQKTNPCYGVVAIDSGGEAPHRKMSARRQGRTQAVEAEVVGTAARSRVRCSSFTVARVPAGHPVAIETVMKVGHYENGKIVGEPTISVLRIPRTLECESLLSLLRSGHACQISVIDSYGGDCSVARATARHCTPK